MHYSSRARLTAAAGRLGLPLPPRDDSPDGETALAVDVATGRPTHRKVPS